LFHLGLVGFQKGDLESQTQELRDAQFAFRGVLKGRLGLGQAIPENIAQGKIAIWEWVVRIKLDRFLPLFRSRFEFAE
jgi:hypothetical protein